MRFGPGMRALAGALLIVGAPALAGAQQRPLVTEDPETIGAGNVLVEAGFDYGREQFFPVSGLEGNLLRLPLVGASFGISSIAEIQLDGGFYNRLTIAERREAPLADMVTATGDRTTSVEDIVVATKVRVLGEAPGRPAIGLRFATKLPTASNESGIGLDTTDFLVSALVGKTVQSIRVVANLGLGILGDPTRGDRQNDVLLYGLSLARAIAEGVEIVGEINGRADTRDGEPPAGTEGRAVMRFGGRYTRGTARVDAGLLLGMTSRDPGIGFTAGVTWVFRGFTVP
ncbi:MAG TPA: transporter [Vicinamibacterales bacterium]|nr:transporter [Vicinamibacterales bacterium]